MRTRARSGGSAPAGCAPARARRSRRRTAERTGARARLRSTQRALGGGEPAAADERGEGPDREPVPAEGSPPRGVDGGDARLGREQRPAFDLSGGDLEQHPDLAGPRPGEAADTAARGPGPARRTENDAVVLAHELLEAEGAHRTLDAPASG